MVLPFEHVCVIKNDYLYKKWTGYTIWKNHPEFNCSRNAIYNHIQKYKDTGEWTRKSGSGRPVIASTEENADATEDLIQSQEDEEGSHVSIRDIAKHLDISKSTVHRLAKARKINSYRRISTPQVNAAARSRRFLRANSLYP